MMNKAEFILILVYQEGGAGTLKVNSFYKGNWYGSLIQELTFLFGENTKSMCNTESGALLLVENCYC